MSKGVVLSIFQQACSVVVAANETYEFVLPFKNCFLPEIGEPGRPLERHESPDPSYHIAVTIRPQWLSLHSSCDGIDHGGQPGDQGADQCYVS